MSSYCTVCRSLMIGRQTELCGRCSSELEIQEYDTKPLRVKARRLNTPASYNENKVPKGHWIVYLPRNRVVAVSDEDFRERFELAPEPEPELESENKNPSSEDIASIRFSLLELE